MEITSLEKILDNTVKRLYIPPSGSWNERVRNVIVLLGASRSGSSLLKKVLSQHKKIAYMSGEEEPWFLLTRNTYPWNGPIINKIRNKQKLLDYLHHDLGVNSNKIDKEQFAQRWRNRLLVQYPKITDTDLQKIPNLIKEFLNNEYNKEPIRNFLDKFSGVELGYYDLFRSENTLFEGEVVIEQPPYIIPAYTRPLSKKDCETKYFLFKSPQNSYRLDIWENLFPNANIFYIHLTRGFAQTVNGLMDGWQYPDGFHSYDIGLQGKELNISGYPDNRWWKFDLPPNWTEFTGSSLGEVCLNQWLQANDYILGLKSNKLHVKFEDFLSNPNEEVEKACKYIGISPVRVGNLPHIMITKDPKPYRWHKRGDYLLSMAGNELVQEMMGRLGYTMNPKEWI